MTHVPDPDLSATPNMDRHQAAPYTSHFVNAGGLRLHYLDYGTAGKKPMLFVHGGAAHGHWFDFIAGGFTPNYHVRALDQRGHGESAWAEPPAYGYQRFARDLGEVAEQLDLRDFVLVGHSMGGTICLIYAATYPGRVGTLIVVDSSLQTSEEQLARLRDRASRPGSTYATLEDLVHRFRLRPGDSEATPETIRYVAEHSARQFPDGAWRHKFDRNVDVMREPTDGLSCWNEIKIPVLLVKGDRSQRITAPVYAEVLARCPQAELAEVLRSGHHVTLDNPSGFLRVVKAFLVQHS